MILADEIRFKVVRSKSQKTGSTQIRKNRERFCQDALTKDRELNNRKETQRDLVTIAYCRNTVDNGKGSKSAHRFY